MHGTRERVGVTQVAMIVHEREVADEMGAER